MVDVDLDKLMQFLLDKKLVEDKAIVRKMKERIKKDKKAKRVG